MRDGSVFSPDFFRKSGRKWSSTIVALVGRWIWNQMLKVSNYKFRGRIGTFYTAGIWHWWFSLGELICILRGGTPYGLIQCWYILWPTSWVQANLHLTSGYKIRTISILMMSLLNLRIDLGWNLHPWSLTVGPGKMMGMEDDPASFWVWVCF